MTISKKDMERIEATIEKHMKLLEDEEKDYNGWPQVVPGYPAVIEKQTENETRWVVATPDKRIKKIFKDRKDALRFYKSIYIEEIEI